MNKKTILILLLVVIIPILLAFGYFTLQRNGRVGSVKNCKDSDGGADYFTKGYIEYPTTISFSQDRSKKEYFIDKTEDECLRKLNPGESTPVHFWSIKHPSGEEEIYERTDCSGNNCYVKEAVCTLKHVEIYQCPNGCRDGACIK